MNDIVTTEQDKPLWQLMQTPAVVKEFELACGREAGSLMIAIINAANNNPEIYQCEPQTVITAALNSVAVNLSLAPALGQSCILPFNKYKQVNGEWVIESKRAEFVPMLRGIKAMAMRTGEYLILNAFKLYEGQEWIEDQMTGLGHIEGKPTSNEVKGFGAYLKLLNGFEATTYKTVSEIMEHAKRYSATWDKKKQQFRAKSKWITDFDDQGLKTVMKALIKHKGVISDKDRAILDKLDAEQASAGAPQWSEDVFNENESEEPTDGEIVENEPKKEISHDLEIACQEKDGKGRLYVSLPTGELRFHLKGIRAKGEKATEQDSIHAQALEMIIAARESGVLEEPGAKQPPLVK